MNNHTNQFVVGFRDVINLLWIMMIKDQFVQSVNSRLIW